MCFFHLRFLFHHMMKYPLNMSVWETIFVSLWHIDKTIFFKAFGLLGNLHFTETVLAIFLVET